MFLEFYSNKGAVRSKNEDSIVGLSLDCCGNSYYVLAVCDGVGGGQEGKFASSTVCSEIEKVVSTDFELNSSDGDVLEKLQSMVTRAILSANKIIYNTYSKFGKQSGTTCTVLITNGVSYNFIHVGDSRLYEVQEIELVPVSVDDTYVQQEISAGRMTEAEALTHPKRHSITKAVGAFKDVNLFKSGILKVEYPMMLTSDGYSDHLKFQTVRDLLVRKNSLSDVADIMMENGQRDNLSAILIDFKGV